MATGRNWRGTAQRVRRFALPWMRDTSVKHRAVLEPTRRRLLIVCRGQELRISSFFGGIGSRRARFHPVATRWILQFGQARLRPCRSFGPATMLLSENVTHSTDPTISY